ncbi:uncharacterized PE-PGRS family protein PE_PGRS24-like [Macrobrachium rosenbergii]|uniref:uncharacterized PE-PGRS family protein PE_PGRS24-like n=1 Tax=Macrobrachium rosenbergii TaxID=79674 RepID=UPI0034D55D6E
MAPVYESRCPGKCDLAPGTGGGWPGIYTPATTPGISLSLLFLQCSDAHTQTRSAMDYKVALVVLMAALALTSAAPRNVIFHRDFFNSPAAAGGSGGVGSGAGGVGASGSNGASAGSSAVNGASGSTGGSNNFLNQAILHHLYNDEFEFDNEDFGLFGRASGLLGQGGGLFGRGGGLFGREGLYDFDAEDGFFPYL